MGGWLVGSDHRACRQLWEDYLDYFRVALTGFHAIEFDGGLVPP
jgi:hypothetical protein